MNNNKKEKQIGRSAKKFLSIMNLALLITRHRQVKNNKKILHIKE